MTDGSIVRAREVVMTWGLPGPDAAADPALSRPLSLDSQQATALISWAAQERLDGLLWSAIAGRAIEFDERSADAARAVHLVGLRMTLAAEVRAAEAADLLAASGIETWVLKGLAAGHLDYADPAIRSSADVDLLVRRADLPAAVSLLERGGHRRAPSTVGAWWEARYARAIELAAPDGGELDLHASIAAGYFGVRLDHDRLRELPQQTVSLAGSDVAALSPEGRLLVSCYALVLSRGGRYRYARDVAQQLLVTRAEVATTAALATGGGDAVIAAAIREVSALLGPVFAETTLDWAASHTASRGAARALALAETGVTHGWAADVASSALGLGARRAPPFLLGAAAAAIRNWRAGGSHRAGDQVRRLVAVWRGGRSPVRKPSNPRRA